MRENINQYQGQRDNFENKESIKYTLNKFRKNHDS